MDERLHHPYNPPLSFKSSISSPYAYIRKNLQILSHIRFPSTLPIALHGKLRKENRFDSSNTLKQEVNYDANVSDCVSDDADLFLRKFDSFSNTGNTIFSNERSLTQLGNQSFSCPSDHLKAVKSVKGDIESSEGVNSSHTYDIVPLNHSLDSINNSDIVNSSSETLRSPNKKKVNAFERLCNNSNKEEELLALSRNDPSRIGLPRSYSNPVSSSEINLLPSLSSSSIHSANPQVPTDSSIITKSTNHSHKRLKTTSIIEWNTGVCSSALANSNLSVSPNSKTRNKPISERYFRFINEENLIQAPHYDVVQRLYLHQKIHDTKIKVLRQVLQKWDLTTGRPLFQPEINP